MCRRPNWNLGRSGSAYTKSEFYFGLGQIRILVWSRQILDLPGPNNSSLARQIQDLPRPKWNLFFKSLQWIPISTKKRNMYYLNFNI